MGIDDILKQELFLIDAWCKDCLRSPEAGLCADCEELFGRYVQAFRKSGWALQEETLQKAADSAEYLGGYPHEDPHESLDITVAWKVQSWLESLADKAQNSREWWTS